MILQLTFSFNKKIQLLVVEIRNSFFIIINFDKAGTKYMILKWHRIEIIINKNIVVMQKLHVAYQISSLKTTS